MNKEQRNYLFQKLDNIYTDILYKESQRLVDIMRNEYIDNVRENLSRSIAIRSKEGVLASNSSYGRSTPQHAWLPCVLTAFVEIPSLRTYEAEIRKKYEDEYNKYKDVLLRKYESMKDQIMFADSLEEAQAFITELNNFVAE